MAHSVVKLPTICYQSSRRATGVKRESFMGEVFIVAAVKLLLQDQFNALASLFIDLVEV